MLYPNRATVCVSCQVGCAVGCAFCATGLMGLARNLGAGEMVAQVVGAAREARLRGRDLNNIVMMGMGEPLQNYAETMKFINIVHDPDGLDIGARRITISTSGIAPKIDALAEEPLQLNLAVSLHAPGDELRSQLVPINRRYPIATLMAAVDRYIAKTRRRVSFEYALMRGINDSEQTALILRTFCAAVSVTSISSLLTPSSSCPTSVPIPRASSTLQAFARGGYPNVHSLLARIGHRRCLRPTARQRTRPFCDVPYAFVNGAASLLVLAAIANAAPSDLVTLARPHFPARLEVAMRADPPTPEPPDGVPISLDSER